MDFELRQMSREQFQRANETLVLAFEDYLLVRELFPQAQIRLKALPYWAGYPLRDGFEPICTEAAPLLVKMVVRLNAIG
jgi:hypothetical protein